MIRPVTLLTALLAAGSGLYLYHAKHVTQLLDNRIAKIQDQIRTDQARVAVLSAQWALENAPSRLAGLAQRYLTLRPMRPSQAIRMADLDSHLPPPFPSGATPGAPGAAPASPLIAGMPPLALYASLAMLSGGSAGTGALVASSAIRAPEISGEPPAKAAGASSAVASLSAPAPTALPEPPLRMAAAPERPPAAPAPAPHVASAHEAPKAPAETEAVDGAPKLVASQRPAAVDTRAPVRLPVEARRAPAPPQPHAVALRAATPVPGVAPVPRAAPAPPPTTPAPILTSALGGRYPNMPPPAPLPVSSTTPR